MRIILDTMGGDKGSAEFVKGALLAMEELDVDIVLVGDEKEISECLKKEDPNNIYTKNISVVNASEVVDMNDDPLRVMKEKPDSSMTVALKLLSEGRGDALVSSGNTGALLTQATLIVKRIKGIRRAALAPVIPTAKGPALLIDSGANAECTTEYLYQFALMGSYYAKNAMGMKEPRVALLNNGVEEHKGDELRRETYKLLKEADENGLINFIGNIEGRDVPLGGADVIVADGFSGNVLLKTIEGTAAFFVKEIKNIFTSSTKGKIAGLMVKSKIGELKKKIDHNTAGGAPLLGVRKPVMKAHGSAGYQSVYSCIVQIIDYIDSGITIKIGKSLGEGNEENE
ncbi:MAG: phosphate acyltransferase PlsX [Ruminococcaceae bacterium]|nr:phosphate acyltransferase PlsX [Oscillospiraceae bacterium]